MWITDRAPLASSRIVLRWVSFPAAGLLLLLLLVSILVCSEQKKKQKGGRGGKGYDMYSTRCIGTLFYFIFPFSLSFLFFFFFFLFPNGLHGGSPVIDGVWEGLIALELFERAGEAQEREKRGEEAGE